MNTYDGADAFPVSVDIPDDSDPPAAATFNVATEGIADRTVFLKNRTSNPMLISIVEASGGTVFTGLGSASCTSGTFTTLDAMLDLAVGALALESGDILDISFVGSFVGAVATFAVALGLRLSAGSVLPVLESAQEFTIPALTNEMPVTLRCAYVYGGGGDTYKLSIMAQPDGSTASLQGVGVWSFVVKHYRPWS